MSSSRLLPHSNEWYDWLETVQEGYFYPWRSQLGMWSGEEAYLALVDHHIHPESDVLEVACAHGEVALGLATKCRSIVAYDRVSSWIERAQQAATARGVTNARFLCHDSSLAANGGEARLPGEDGSYDVMICRKGPFHWVEDARRVGRPGAVMLMLVPDATPLTPWHARLPESLQWKGAPLGWARPSIENRLNKTGLRLHSWWSYDVPELFPDVEALYEWLIWGRGHSEIPSLAEIGPVLETIFAEFGGSDGGSDGVEIRRRLYLWKSVLP